jgi:hypothetical protein
MPSGSVTPPPAAATGPSQPNIRRVTASTTASESDDIILADCTAGNMTITIHPASTASGKAFMVKRVDTTSNVLTIAPSAGDTIMEGTITVNTPMVNFSFRTDRNKTWFSTANYWPYQMTTPATDAPGGNIGGGTGQQVIVLGDHQHPTSVTPIALRSIITTLAIGVVDAVTITRAGTYNTIMPGKLSVAGATQTIVQIRKNGTVVATVTYPGGNVNGTVTGFSPVAVVPGDLIDLNVTAAGLAALGLKIGLDK